MTHLQGLQRMMLFSSQSDAKSLQNVEAVAEVRVPICQIYAACGSLESASLVE